MQGDTLISIWLYLIIIIYPFVSYVMLFVYFQQESKEQNWSVPVVFNIQLTVTYIFDK